MHSTSGVRYPEEWRNIWDLNHRWADCAFFSSWRSFSYVPCTASNDVWDRQRYRKMMSWPIAWNYHGILLETLLTSVQLISRSRHETHVPDYNSKVWLLHQLPRSKSMNREDGFYVWNEDVNALSIGLEDVWQGMFVVNSGKSTSSHKSFNEF